MARASCELMCRVTSICMKTIISHLIPHSFYLPKVGRQHLLRSLRGQVLLLHSSAHFVFREGPPPKL